MKRLVGIAAVLTLGLAAGLAVTSLGAIGTRGDVVPATSPTVSSEPSPTGVPVHGAVTAGIPPSIAPGPILPRMNNGPLTLFGFLNAVKQVDTNGAFHKPLIQCGGSCTVITSASWTADGTKLAFAVESCCAGGTAGDPYHGIRVLDVRTGKDRLIAPGEDFGVLDWSPDWTRIAFTDGSEPFIMNADGSNVKPIPVMGIAQIESIAWSPDGTSIAYSTDRKMYIEGVDGSSPKALGSGRDPNWAPDGMRIAYASADRCQVWTMSPDGTHRTKVAQVTPRPHRPDTCSPAIQIPWQPGPPGPTWSPDGRMIAFISGRGLFTVNRDGSDFRRVSAADPYEGIAWRPVR